MPNNEQTIRVRSLVASIDLPTREISRVTGISSRDLRHYLAGSRSPRTDHFRLLQWLEWGMRYSEDGETSQLLTDLATLTEQEA